MNPPPPPPLLPPEAAAAASLPSHRPIPPPPPSLTHVLSDISHLLHLSTTALTSLPTPIHAATSAAAATFVPCPFNPNHRLPPSSLFSHYLNCPSPLSLPHSFHYPLTLRSSSSTAAAAPRTLPAESSELVISLEKYTAYNAPANDFFYRNCPGPVTPKYQTPTSLKLPRILYTVCADFNKESPLEASADIIRFLPSEIWAIRSEIESWGGGLPSVYSSRVLRAILRLKECNLLQLYDWIISNSPRYGIIIDCAMRDHLVLLVKLCLKVIVGEAHELAGFTHINGEMNKTKNVLSGLGNRSFECPVLVKVMAWLALQLSVLYGEVNGKYFAVDMLKECISETAFHASLFPLEGKDDELRNAENAYRNVEKQAQSVASIDSTDWDGIEGMESKTVGESMIFISEVAAAVAALHERYLIEEKIKALRYAKPPSAYQRNLEHALVSKIADEERQKRPEYRPVVEYDGFLRHRSSDQGGNKVKTKEELLAEERDYKRRRMSYRGKKLKRNTVEVMREIIEEHMEELRQAGGVSGMSKAVEETEALASENIDRHASGFNDSRSRRNSEIPENRGRSVDYKKDIHSHHYSVDHKYDNRQPRLVSSWDRGHWYANRTTERIRYDRDGISATRDGRKINSHPREQLDGREKSDNVEAFADDSQRSHQRRSVSQDRDCYKSTRDECDQRTRKRRDEDGRSSHKKERTEVYWEHEDRERSKNKASLERYVDKGRHDHRRKSKTNWSSSSRCELYEFEDRYDPAISPDLYEDDY